VDAQLLLELDHQLEQDAVAVLGVSDDAGELPEVGLLLARGGAQRGRVDGADALGEDAEAATAEDLARVVADLLEVRGALDEDVRAPWRISSPQILVGMSTSRPQPSPSPSTLPARWSIF
jgi:hypothetical protein